jgi:hypothetical protein
MRAVVGFFWTPAVARDNVGMVRIAVRGGECAQCAADSGWST